MLELHENTFSDAVPDGFFFGEGEHITGQLVYDILKIQKSKPEISAVDKEKKYFALVKKYSGYYPFGYDGTIKQNINHNQLIEPEYYPIFASHESNTVRMEISAGCPYFCNFCFEGFERKPYRIIPLHALIEQVKKTKNAIRCKHNRNFKL